MSEHSHQPLWQESEKPGGPLDPYEGAAIKALVDLDIALTQWERFDAGVSGADVSMAHAKFKEAILRRDNRLDNQSGPRSAVD